nr:hypothetical protein [Neisseria polysaccharea]
MRAELAAKSEKEQQVRRDQLDKHFAHSRQMRDLDEKQIRLLLIDVQLREAGWEADTENLNYQKGTCPEKGRNLAIAEYPCGKDRADYVLFCGLMPISTADEAHQEKSRHFLKKNFGSLLHYLQLPCTFIKVTVIIAFVLPIADNQFAAGFLRFVPTDGIDKLKAGGSEIFEQLSNIGMVVNRQYNFALCHCFCKQLVLHPIKRTGIACCLPIRRVGIEEGMFAVVAFKVPFPRFVFNEYTIQSGFCSGQFCFDFVGWC